VVVRLRSKLEVEEGRGCVVVIDARGMVSKYCYSKSRGRESVTTHEYESDQSGVAYYYLTSNLSMVGFLVKISCSSL